MRQTDSHPIIITSTLSQDTQDIFKASYLLELTNQQISKGNIAKLLGVSIRTLSRKITTANIDFSKLSKPRCSDMCHTIPSHMHSTISLVKVWHPVTNNELILASNRMKCIGSSLGKLIDIQYDSRAVLSSCLVRSLLKYKFMHPLTAFQTQIHYANSLTDIIHNIASSGGKIHHSNHSLEYLMRKDRSFSFTQLLERHGNYSPSRHSYSYRYTDFLTDVILPDTMNLFLSLDFSRSRSRLPNDLIVTRGMLSNIQARDLFLLLSRAVGVNANGDFIVRYEELDRQRSRKYNTFTAIKSETRKTLGYINYDIDTALQSIVFQFLDKDNYPAHKLLIKNKHLVRSHLCRRLGKSIDDVKTILSASDNGKKYKLYQSKSKFLTQYIKESAQMVYEFNQLIRTTHPERDRISNTHAKRVFEYDRKKEKWIKTDRLNQFSKFFFNWTQIERNIRDVMVDCFKSKVDTREVHDAVYSKENIDPKIIEEAIYKQLGLTIKVSKD